MVLTTPQTADAATRSSFTLRWSATTAWVGNALSVSGQVRPAAVRTVSLQRRTSAGSWVTVRSVKTSRSGAYRLGIPSSKARSSVYRVRVAKAGRAVAMTSKSQRVTVRVRPTDAPKQNAPAFALSYVDSLGRPARWDPCTVIRVRVNHDGAPSDADNLVKTALEKLHDASGLTFSVVGSTSYVPFAGTGTREPDADLVIAWSDAAHVDGLASSTVGLGGFSATMTVKGPRATLGQVVLDTSHPGMANGFVNGAATGTVLLHELGHAVGLSHVSDRTQVMYPSITSASRPAYQDGDRAGLAKVGAAAGCL